MDPTSEVTIVPFKREHIFPLTSRAVETFSATREELEEMSYRWDSGPAYTAFYQGKIIACAGVMMLWRGVGQAWVIFDTVIQEHLRKEAYELVTPYLIQIIKDYKLHRVQAIVEVGFDIALKYALNMGFSEEGYLNRYDSQGKDYIMLSLPILWNLNLDRGKLFGVK
jgi:RimJ/RimL family protein N-acetyltransferase